GICGKVGAVLPSFNWILVKSPPRCSRIGCEGWSMKGSSGVAASRHLHRLSATSISAVRTESPGNIPHRLIAISRESVGLLTDADNSEVDGDNRLFGNQRFEIRRFGVNERDRDLIGIGRRSPTDPCRTTVRTGRYTAVRGAGANPHRSRWGVQAI